MLITMVVRKIKYYLGNRSYESKRKYLTKQGAIIGENTRLICRTDALGTEPYLIQIGSNCLLAGDVKIITHDGGVKVLNALGYFGDVYNNKMARVKIGSNVYIGTGALVMPGVVIGDNCIIGAYAIVTKNIPSNSVAVGIPAKVIKTIDEYYESAIESGTLYPTPKMSCEERKEYLRNTVSQLDNI